MRLAVTVAYLADSGVGGSLELVAPPYGPVRPATEAHFGLDWRRTLDIPRPAWAR